MQKRLAFIIPFIVLSLFLIFPLSAQGQNSVTYYLHDGELLDDSEPDKTNDSVYNLREKGIWMTSSLAFDMTISGDIDVFLWLRGMEPRYPWTLVRIPKVALYDIHPDGDRFLMLKGEESVRNQINIVLNWFEVLKEIMAGAGE